MEQRIESLERRVDAIEGQMRVNTALLHEIQSDTREIVTIVKGSKLGGRLLGWFATVSGAGAALYVALRDIFHGHL